MALVLACGGDRSGGAPPPASTGGGEAAPAANGAAAPSGEATRSGGVSAPSSAAEDGRAVVLFLGNSLTAGLGVGEDLAFPALVQAKIDSAGLPFRVVNAGVSGETSADGLRRIDWLLRQPVRVLVLELGANDALRGQDVAAMKSNLRQIIERTRARYPDVEVVLAGMEAPPNLGPRYTASFHDAWRDLAREEHAVLIPFLLEDVAGIARLNQEDRIHPTAEGHRIVAANVWRVLEPVLRRVATAARTREGAGGG